MVFTASLLGTQQNRDSEENKSESLLAVSLGKTHGTLPPFMWQTGGGAKQSTGHGGPV